MTLESTRRHEQSPKILIACRKASFWRRTGAFLIDVFTFGIVVDAFKIALAPGGSFDHEWDFILFYAYNIGMDYYFSGSLGKKVLNLRVIAGKNRPITFANAFYRNLGKIVSTLPFMYGYFRILAPHHEQTIHDELGHCYVVEVLGQQEKFT